MSKLPLVQFTCHDPSLLSRIAADVRRSSFPTRVKYLNALTDLTLSLPHGRHTACVDELLYLVQVFYSLPIERIQLLATAHSRTFDQMLVYLVDNALLQHPKEKTITQMMQEKTTWLETDRSPLSLPGNFASRQSLA